MKWIKVVPVARRITSTTEIIKDKTIVLFLPKKSAKAPDGTSSSAVPKVTIERIKVTLSTVNNCSSRYRARMGA